MYLHTASFDVGLPSILSVHNPYFCAEEAPLRLFQVTARTILELGSELISSDIIAFYELVKNGFDAGSKTGVEVHFDVALSRHAYLKLLQKIVPRGDGHEKEGKNLDLDELRGLVLGALNANASEGAIAGFTEAVAKARTRKDLATRLTEAQARCNTITVSDTGSGMSIDDLRRNFLVIGTASRKREVDAALAAGKDSSPYLGEKGIGRLSAMRLGERLLVKTATKEDVALNVLEIDWRVFGNIEAMLHEIQVEPKQGLKKPNPKWQGTSIVISDLAENWTEKRARDMAEYDFARLTNPFLDASTRPRIAIYWNGARLAIPLMDPALLNAAHARVSGEYEIKDGKPVLTCTVEALDLGFEHPRERSVIKLPVEDLEGAIIGKEGQIEDAALISVGPFSFEAHWYNRRRLSRVDAIGDQRAVRELQEKWSGILLFRDRFRVFPYGEDEDDWLELDRRALRRSGYTLNKTQFVGRVSISRTANPELVDQTNREGLRVTPEQHVLLQVIRYAVQDLLGRFMEDVKTQYQQQKIDLSAAQAQVSLLEARANAALKKLRKITPPESRSVVEDLQQTLFEFTEFAARARERIAQVEQESRQMVEMAGVGLMVEVVAHELARASENALKALNGLRGKDVPEQLRGHFNTLKAEMKSLSKRVRVLDPLSISGRQRTEVFSLNELISDACEAHDAQFQRHNVRLKLDLPERPLNVRAVKGMIVQIVENLISNSIYWMDIRAEREPSYRPEIRITLESGPPTLTFEDNGRGIAPDNREQVFKMFFSLRETRTRRGLGLYIAREAAQHNGGTLTLDPHVNAATGRLHRFVLELPQGAQI